jgi:LysR family transcriptional regulator, regulator for bpeEF and oprC
MTGIQGLAAFAATARHGSFTAAARELGLSPSAVAKSVARLETDLGLRLFQRTTRQVSLTSDGHELQQRCQGIVDDIDALRALAEGVRGEPSGTVRISAPFTFGKRTLMPVLAALLARHPRLRLELVLSDRFVDLVAEGYDAAIRIGSLADSTLVAKRVAVQQLVVCAAPAYLARFGRPGSPQRLAEHQCMLFRLPTTGRVRPWEFMVDRQAATMVPTSSVHLNDGEGLVAAAVAGMGLTQVPFSMAEEALRAGALIEVLRAFRPAAVPVSLVYASGRQMPPRLRVLIDALSAPALRRLPRRSR